METVATGALAIIKVNGITIGRMQDVSVQEDPTRQEVRGIGEIIPLEAPVVSWAGRLTCSQMMIDFQKSGIPKAIKRDVQTNREFADQLLLDTQGVQVDIFKKVEDAIDPNTGLIKPKLKPFAVVRQCLINSDGFSISEGAIVRRNQSFTTLSPVIFPK